MKLYWGLYLLLIALLATASQGAVIHGSVYDLELNTLSQAVVEIDTVPKQVMVSRNGTYKFSVPPGEYIITAKHAVLDLLTSEPITVQEEGTFVLDLILFPDLGLEEELLEETMGEVPEYDEPEPFPLWGVIVIILAILAALAWIYLKRRKPKEEEKKTAKADLSEILAFVKKEGGRTTQKDLRKAIPYSEAKISLMIAELESQGKLKKIKKGRGNIIILP